MKTESEHINASSVCSCMTEDFVKKGKVIITSPFKSSATEYFSLAITQNIKTYLWIIVIPLLIFSSLALFVNIRWIFIALIFLFLVAPFIIANTYFSKLLTREARMALSRKKLRVVSGKIIETYFVDENDEITSTEHIQFSDIKDIRERANSWIIELKDSSIGGIIIPKQTIVEIYEQQNDGNSTNSSNFFD
ncbi:MAG: hypothetical protein K2K08_09115 [Paramuribaculum sp.]|nr:hypothetical protein [Paramuribaculum sp.]